MGNTMGCVVGWDVPVSGAVAVVAVVRWWWWDFRTANRSRGIHWLQVVSDSRMMLLIQNFFGG